MVSFLNALMHAQKSTVLLVQLISGYQKACARFILQMRVA